MGKIKKKTPVTNVQGTSDNKLVKRTNIKSLPNRKRRSQNKGNRKHGDSVEKRKRREEKHRNDQEMDNSDFEIVDTDLKDQKEKSNIHVEDDSDSDKEYKDTRKWVTAQNRKKKKSGGFQSMGLSHTVFKGVIRKGYKIPTPIQRKTVPVILDGKDVVAMARTGSGKTAAFLIPMFEKLKSHTGKSGARALILSPTRELALQTLKFTKELGKFTGLKAAVILGGDRMEDQFSALHENPDIIIATPGRLLHVLMEMNLKLKSVEYTVFDEADRLFEMGFQEQLHEIIHRLPGSRQTLLFSATLPKQLVEFAKAGLHDPTLIRLDVETKLSELLKLSFFHCREDDKTAILLYFLKHIIDPDEQTVVFTATKHHVEYLNLILQEAGISCTYIYSSLDQAARKINVAKFQNKKVNVMIVTDLAARGIDIPLLDNVINYNFPAKAKLFVHRVGRVARAGRSGTAYTLVSQDEIPFLLDLYVFLGKSLKIVPAGKSIPDEDSLLGVVPQMIIDDMEEDLLVWMTENADISSMKKVCSNAMKKYVKSRPAPASESIKRFKEMNRNGFRPGTHPLFETHKNSEEKERLDLLQALKSYKANNTVFETNSTNKTKAFEVMKLKRGLHEGVIQKRQAKIVENADRLKASEAENHQEMETADDSVVNETFSVVIGGKRKQGQQLLFEPKKKRKNLSGKDEEFFIHYRPTDFQSEKGLSLGSTFDKDATNAILDVSGSGEQVIQKPRSNMKWDRKKKKFVNISEQQANKKKIRTESGAVISATYKTNVYNEWREKNKIDMREDDDEDDENDDEYSSQQGSGDRFKVTGTKLRRWHTKGMDKEKDLNENVQQHHKNSKGKKTFRRGKRELKRPEQIMKARKVKAQKEAFQKHRQQQNKKKRNFSQQMSKKRGR